MANNELFIHRERERHKALKRQKKPGSRMKRMRTNRTNQQNSFEEFVFATTGSKGTTETTNRLFHRRGAKFAKRGLQSKIENPKWFEPRIARITGTKREPKYRMDKIDKMKRLRRSCKSCLVEESLCQDPKSKIQNRLVLLNFSLIW